MVKLCSRLSLFVESSLDLSNLPYISQTAVEEMKEYSTSSSVREIFCGDIEIFTSGTAKDTRMQIGIVAVS